MLVDNTAGIGEWYGANATDAANADYQTTLLADMTRSFTPEEVLANTWNNHRLGAGLAQTLHTHGLIDEYRVFIEPLVLGTGKRLFEPGAAPTALRVVESRPIASARCWPPTTSPGSPPTASSRWRSASAYLTPEGA